MRSSMAAVAALVIGGCSTAGIDKPVTPTSPTGGSSTPSTPAATGPGISWRAATAPAGGTGWYGVAFGNGIYAAVGFGIRGASFTGASWSSALFTQTAYYFAGSVVFANGLFMAPTEHAVTSSSTALTWSAVAVSSAQALRGLAYGNGKWVAVDDRFLSEDVIAFFTSANNGASWQQVVTNIAYAQPTAIAFGNGVFVAVGYGALVATSPDGTTWTRRTFNASSTDAGVVNVVFANGLFLAMTNSGVVFKSSDGVTWTRVKVSVSALWSAVYGNGLYVVVGSAAGIYTSADAVTWTSRTAPAGSSDFNAVAFSGSQFVAVGRQFAVSP